MWDVWGPLDRLGLVRMTPWRVPASTAVDGQHGPVAHGLLECNAPVAAAWARPWRDAGAAAAPAAKPAAPRTGASTRTSASVAGALAGEAEAAAAVLVHAPSATAPGEPAASPAAPPAGAPTAQPAGSEGPAAARACAACAAAWAALRCTTAARPAAARTGRSTSPSAGGGTRSARQRRPAAAGRAPDSRSAAVDVARACEHFSKLDKRCGKGCAPLKRTDAAVHSGARGARAFHRWQGDHGSARAPSPAPASPAQQVTHHAVTTQAWG